MERDLAHHIVPHKVEEYWHNGEHRMLRTCTVVNEKCPPKHAPHLESQLWSEDSCKRAKECGSMAQQKMETTWPQKLPQSRDTHAQFGAMTRVAKYNI